MTPKQKIKLLPGILTALFLMSFFIFVKNTRAADYEFSYNGIPNYYKQPSKTGNVGVVFYAPQTNYLNYWDFIYCKESYALDFNMYARIGAYTSPTNINWLATSSYISSDNFPIQNYSGNAQNTALLCYLKDNNINTFTFPPVSLTHNTRYIVAMYMDTNTNRGFWLNRTEDTEYDLIEGYTLQDSLTPWFNLGYNQNARFEWTPSPYLDPTLLDWRSDINTLKYKICYFYENCNLWFSYNNAAIGNTVYLTPDKSGQQNPDFATASTTIGYDARMAAAIDLPDSTTATKTPYCLYMTDSTYGDLLYCGITVEYMASSTWDARFTMQDICDTVATSSGDIWDDIRYGFECGFRRLIYFAFVPDDQVMKDFYSSGEKLKTIFPLNTYFELSAAVQAGISGASTSTAATLGVPMVTNTGDFYILPVLASSSMSNAIGESNNTLYRLTLGYVMWIFTAAFCFLSVRKFLKI